LTASIEKCNLNELFPKTETAKKACGSPLLARVWWVIADGRYFRMHPDRFKRTAKSIFIPYRGF